jgi:general stress protein YciG
LAALEQEKEQEQQKEGKNKEEKKQQEEQKEQKQEEKRQQKGLARASKRTRLRVARLGGNAYHNVPQGLGSFSGDPEKLRAIAIAGGLSRAKNRKGLSEAGSKGGAVILATYGREHLSKIGKKGGTTTSTNREFMAEIGKKGGRKTVQVYGYEFLTEISRNRKMKKRIKKEKTRKT